MTTSIDFGDTEDYPWPQKGDDPFLLAEDWPNNACLNFMPDAPWYGYARGFKLVGDLAVRYVEEKSADQDFLVYSILYSYRHYIELSLKQLIMDARRLTDVQGDDPIGHNLMSLWNTARPLLLQIEPASKQDVSNAEAIIARFHQLDGNGETWRYPVDRGGKATLPKDLFHINLRQVRDVVHRLSGYLDAAGAQIDAYMEFKSDWESDMRGAW